MFAVGAQVRVKSTGELGEIVTPPDALGQALIAFASGERRPVFVADLRAAA